MTNPTIHFGTGGWRAVIGDDFIRSNIRLVAAGVVQLMHHENKTDKPVVIGYDRRFLSEQAAKWVAELFAASGVKVLFIGRSSPTPLVMHTVKSMKLHYGIEITASHNPSQYNGIKLIVDEGRDAPLETTTLLEEFIAAATDLPETDFAEQVALGNIEYIVNPFNHFLDDIIGLLDMEALRKRGLRVIFDSMHGSGTYALMVILHTVRCTVDVIHTERDAYFGGIAPAPSEHSLGELSEKVVDGGYDLGIALDGDGDRLGIIDSSGRYIAANEILVMLYYYLHEYKGWKGPVVRNMSTTHMLDAVANALGEACYEVPVGFKWISAKIDEVDAVLGGESSGGLTVRGHIHGKDSAYAAALFVEMVSAMNASPARIMADLTARFGSFEIADSDFSYPAEQKSQLTHLLFEQKALPAFDRPVRRVSYEDGCKVYFEDGGFVVCRFSGTEPLLRFCAEADTKEKALASIQAFKDMLKL